MKQKFIFIILLLTAIAGFFAFWFYREGAFSKEILRLEILGPKEAKTGEEIEYTIKYKNNGNFVLESPKLIFEFPDNSITEEGKTRITQELDDIYPGDENFIKFKARLLGKQDDLKVAKAQLSYMPKNITARYESNTTFTTKLNEAAVTLDFDLPSKAEQGKEIQYSVNYFSNLDYTLENLIIRIEPIDGFTFGSSKPASLDKIEWKLGALNKSEGGRITIKGIVTARTGQNLNFSAQLGTLKDGEFIPIKQTDKEVEVIEPLLFISQQVNGSSNYIASPGEELHYEIFFRNIGSTPFDDLFMITTLNGSAFDLSSIEAPDGQAQTSSNIIVWDYKRVSELRHLGIQQEGSVEFTVKLKNSWQPSNPETDTVIKNNVNISQITQDFSIKVASGVNISQKAFYYNSGIQNSGPVPPESGHPTTYSITWDIKNYISDIKNVKVKATLPFNVSLTGHILPENELPNFSFDSNSREIVWSAGDIPAGVGVNGDPYTISFQVSLTPDSSQRGSFATLIGQAQASGENSYTSTMVQSVAQSATTNLTNDSKNPENGVVK